MTYNDPDLASALEGSTPKQMRRSERASRLPHVVLDVSFLSDGFE